MDRANYFPQTQIVKCKMLPLTLIGGGSGKAPTVGVGDASGSYFSTALTSTGIWTLTMKDPIPVGGVIAVIPTVMQATGAGTLTIQMSPAPSQNTTTSLWTFTFNTFVSGSASDMLAGDQANIVLFLSNSTQIQ